MTLILTYDDGTTLRLETVQAVSVVDGHTLRTQCYGNESVLQRHVKEARVWFRCNAAEVQPEAEPVADVGGVTQALLVFTRDPRLVAWLETHDPMALRQARTALRDAGINADAPSAAWERGA